MKSYHTLFFLFIVLGMTACSTPTSGRNEIITPPSGKISLTEMESASKQLQKLFGSLDVKRLSALSNSKDETVALHATWELAKAKPAEVDRFLKKFESASGVTPPRWWQQCIRSIRVYEGNCHYVPNVIPRGDDKKERIVYGDHKIMAKPSSAGFPYPITISKSNSNTTGMKVEVWAVGRTLLAGCGAHQMEMRAMNGKLYVFGAESHGAYAEIFRIVDGQPLLRFSTCYWFNFSEKWNKQ